MVSALFTSDWEGSNPSREWGEEKVWSPEDTDRRGGNEPGPNAPTLSSLAAGLDLEGKGGTQGGWWPPWLFWMQNNKKGVPKSGDPHERL